MSASIGDLIGDSIGDSKKNLNASSKPFVPASLCHHNKQVKDTEAHYCDGKRFDVVISDVLIGWVERTGGKWRGYCNIPGGPAVDLIYIVRFPIGGRDSIKTFRESVISWEHKHYHTLHETIAEVWIVRDHFRSKSLYQ
ncbi:hypothetical protein [Acanthamoeba polyphaga mimivirus]|nr:hypothetical protein [Acanthamoeba castellanii mamavirus]EJN41227.1 hypothetical protein lvs_R116 [Acanthamoeba polyphaga lentillevirus]UMZ08333.1 hypothetical protein [Acanthamoeba polyphaga mimivirus]